MGRTRGVGEEGQDCLRDRAAVVVAVERGGALIVPRGDVVLTAGDRLSLFAAPGSDAAARRLLDAVRDEVADD